MADVHLKQADSQIGFSARVEIDYPYIIGAGSLARLGYYLETLLGDERSAFLVTDAVVAPLFAERIEAQIESAGWHYLGRFVFAPGERSKSATTYASLVDQMIESGVHRRSVVIAAGGGVACDLAGYAAATYMRGIDYASVPTSLMAQVDASIGGKVGINHPRSKNFIGAFWHPKAVLIDPELLASLPDVEISNGLAEAVKVGVIHSPALFESLELHGQALLSNPRPVEALMGLIRMAVQGKVDLLLPDPFEVDLRRLLNLGHTFAHPLEVAHGFELPHGFAVAAGMCIATRVAMARDLIAEVDAQRLFRLLHRLRLPVEPPRIDPHEVWFHAGIVRRIRANNLFFVVPTGIGSAAIINDLTEDEFVRAYRP